MTAPSNRRIHGASAVSLHPVSVACLMALVAVPQAALAQSSSPAAATALQEVTVKSAAEAPDTSIFQFRYEPEARSD